MYKLITAIYDKKAKSLGRPIYQENIEKAIAGVTDALNSTNGNGEYLMPAHREHPEDYCLMQLGYLHEDAKEEIVFNPETGEHKKIEKTDPFLIVEEKVICEFKDIEIKDIQSKISAETVYQLLNEIKKDMSTDIYDNVMKGMAETNTTMIEIANKLNHKKGLFKWKK